IGFSGAMSGRSAHFTAGSSQLMHWRSVRPEMVTTGISRFPHFGQCVIRSMRSSRFCPPNSEQEFLFHSGVSAEGRAGGLADRRNPPFYLLRKADYAPCELGCDL